MVFFIIKLLLSPSITECITQIKVSFPGIVVINNLKNKKRYFYYLFFKKKFKRNIYHFFIEKK
jgi:hypothetical protein